MEDRQPLLSVGFSVDYPNRPRTLKHVFFDLGNGEMLGLVGQSGAGKSTICLAILKLLALKGGRTAGHITFCGQDLMKLPEREMRRIRGREIGLVLQSPLSSLNPALRISTQLAEAWRAHASGTKHDCAAHVARALASVALPQDREFLDRYPSQLSIGQAQRVLIAMAVMHGPSLLIADEPTSALDVITQAEIIKLFADLNRTMGSALLYISHDLLSVLSLCHRIAILHEGEIVECGPVQQLVANPTHPYTKRLIGALPRGLDHLSSKRPLTFPVPLLPLGADKRARRVVLQSVLSPGAIEGEQPVPPQH